MSTFVHIGYSKTGTKWFQNSFFPFIRNLSFIDLTNTNKLFLTTDIFLLDNEKIKQDIKKLSDPSKPITLLSSECLATPINYGWHYGYYSYSIAQKIKSVIPDASVIIFIRRQQSLIASAYQQYLKNGGTYSFRRWLYSGEVFSFEHLVFDKLIDYYVSLFGVEKVRVYLYEDFRKDNKFFLTRFCEENGFEVDWKTVSFQRVNKGLRIFSMPLLKLVNYFYKKPVGRKRFICHVPGMTLVGKIIIRHLNPLPIFGRYLNEDDFLKFKDLEYIRNFYSIHNRRLTKYFTKEVLEKYGYFL